MGKDNLIYCTQSQIKREEGGTKESDNGHILFPEDFATNKRNYP